MNSLTIFRTAAIGWWMLCIFSCTKFKDRLDTVNGDSGIIGIVRSGQTIAEAQIDEQVTVYAKIGRAGSDIKMFVSDVEASIVSRGTSNADGYQKDTFNIVVPRLAKIGPGSIYFTLNGAVQPSLAFTVKRPDILFAGKVWVEPYLFTYSDSTGSDPNTVGGGGWDYTFPDVLRDGSSRVAVVNSVIKLAYDKDAGVFYFLDFQTSDHSLRLRKLKDGMVTTIAGGGNDYFATKGAELKIGTDGFSNNGLDPLDMRPGPDGKLYFTNRFSTEPDPVTGLPSAYSLIERIDPVTGGVEIIAGNNHRNVEYYYSNTVLNYRGLEDGTKDSAMISSPTGLAFGKEGDLYFIDGDALLRRLGKDGSIHTILGKVDRMIYDFEDADGKIYHPLFYTAIDEHSDGFGDGVRLSGCKNMVRAGNGKFYLFSLGGGGWDYNIVEVNMDTKEASTIIGLQNGERSNFTTGTFKEVGLTYTSTFDVDFDGNILFGFTTIYKMDLQAETITKMTSFTDFPPQYTSQRQFMQERQPGTNCIIGRLNRIVFDQFGNLYAGYDQVAASSDVRIAKVVIEKQ